MRNSRVFLALVAICLCGAGANAQDVPGALQQMLSAGGLLTGGAPVGGSLKNTLEAFKAAASASVSAVGTAAGAAGAQAELALAAFEADHCTPAEFTPSEKIPATFVGHSMAVTFSLGNCTFNESKWLGDDIKELDCYEPSISYAKSPATFTSKYHSAPTFTSKECKVTKPFGEATEVVLFVFDGTKAPDMNELTAKISAEVTKVLGTVGSGVQDLVGKSKGLFAGTMGAGATGAAPAFAYS